MLEGYARTVARGAAGRTMRDNIAAWDALVSAGLVADGSTVDGSSRTGGQPYDAVVAQFPHEPLSAWEVPAPLLQGIGGGSGLGVFDVTVIGADPTGVLDSAPAFNAAMGSNRIVYIPPGTYRFASTQPPPAPYTHPHPCCVLIDSYYNFVVTGYAATIVVDDGVALSEAFLIARCHDFIFEGLTIQGTRKSLTIVAQINVGLMGHSWERFLIQDLHFTGNFGHSGAGIDGDWIVNGTYRNIVMDAVGFGFDMAYLYNVIFENIRVRGSDAHFDATIPSLPGGLGLSIIVDPPNATYNFTSVPFTETEFVTVRNCDFVNMTAGFKTTTGKHITLMGNRWHDFPGHLATSASGTVQFTGTPGVTVPIGSAVARTSDSGAYTSTADAVVGATGVVLVPIIANTTGTTTNSAIGTAFTLSAPPPGVSSSGTASVPIEGGYSITTPAGIIISYDAVNGQGVAPQQIEVLGDVVTNVGYLQAGYGLLLGDVSVIPPDQIKDILISGCLFDNNYHVGIASNTSSPSIANIRIIGNSFTGAAQTTAVGVNTLAAAVMLYNGETGLQMNNGNLISFLDTGGFPATIGAEPGPGGSVNSLVIGGTDSGGGVRNFMVAPLTSDTSIPYFPQGVRVSSVAGASWEGGPGVPTATRNVGSLWSRTDGGVGTTLYVSRGGGTWNAVAGV
jgi:hypothetical protein